MKIKILSAIFLSVFAIGTIIAQKVKLKDNIVYLDGKEIMKYEKREMGSELYLYQLNDDNEDIFIQFRNNGTVKYREDDYVKILFVKQDKSLETTKSHTNAGRIKWLLQNKVINTDGSINPEKTDTFIKKYDEKISERKIW